MIFKYDPGTLRADLQKNGYAHLKDVLSDEFVGQLQDFYESSMKDADTESEDWKIAGKKRQFVFNFPSSEAAQEFKTGLARLTGIDEDTFTISERHLKVYDKHANPYPAPHKDRSASFYSIGLPVFLPEGSTVCLFPELDAEPNKEDHAVFLTERDRPDLEKIYDNEKALMLNENVGDIVIFLGSALWHERVRGAGTAVLYIKVNGEGVDPLGENIYAAAM
ncbi:MAG: hypothetical protein ACP5DX_00850 [Paracoccaceae bacterium]